MVATNENESRFSLEYFVNNYERLKTSIYPVSALLEARLAAPYVPSQTQHPTVVEIGGGSGTSMFYLAQQYQELGFSPEYFMTEPTYGGTRVAVYKLGALSDINTPPNPPMTADERWGKILTENHVSITPVSETSILEKRQMMASLRSPSVIQAWGEQLPIASDTVDIIHMIQVYHWTNRPRLLSEVNRVLKPGQICTFDETGLQFHFDPMADGKDINGYQYVNHPFHKAFVTELNILFSQKGLPPLDSEKIDRFHNMFNFQSLQKEFQHAGFSLATIDPKSWEEHVAKVAEKTGKELAPFVSPNGRYAGIIDFRSPDDLNFITNAGVMRYFNDPERAKLDIEQKNSLISEALQHTDRNLLTGSPIAETGVYFVLQKSNKTI